MAHGNCMVSNGIRHLADPGHAGCPSLYGYVHICVASDQPALASAPDQVAEVVSSVDKVLRRALFAGHDYYSAIRGPQVTASAKYARAGTFRGVGEPKELQ